MKMWQGYVPRNIIYSDVTRKIKSMGYSFSNYPISSFEIVKKINKTNNNKIEIHFLNFKTTKIGGVLIRGDEISHIGLNSLLPEESLNFNCMHELIHYWFHPNLNFTYCYITNEYILTDPRYEYQANEGTAQALMPYQLFIPKYYEFKGNIERIANFFGVSKTAVEYRIENLRFEFLQYEYGVKVEDIHLNQLPKSHTQRVFILNWLENALRLLAKKFCPRCDNKKIQNDSNFCPICGNRILKWGEGTMIYNDGFELDKNGKAIICPKCGNEEINEDGEYCKICGTYLVNKCTYKDMYGNECGAIADGNARYCKKCGSPTTFYEQGLLEDWTLARKKIIEQRETIITTIEEDSEPPF